MSINFKCLNSLISEGYKTNDLLEEKIKENELTFLAPNNLEEINSKNELSKEKEKGILKPFYNPEEENKSLPLTKKKIKKSDFSFSSNKASIIETNISNNTDIINKNNNLNSSNNSSNNTLAITKENDAYYEQEMKRRNINKEISIFNMKNNNIGMCNNMKAKYCQYISLLSNKKNWNNSVEKRANHTNRNNLNNKTVNEDRFAITYKRFIEKDRKRKEKVSKMKKIKEEQENKIYSHKPVIDKNSRKISSKNNEDFFSRQKRLLEKKEKKNDMIKRRIKENENVQIKTNKKLKNKKDREKSVEETIHKLYDWETKRKEKLNQIRKSEERKKLYNNFHSKSKNKVRVNPDDVVNRLYKVDIEKRREKAVLLKNSLTPTFQPTLTRNNSSMSSSSSDSDNIDSSITTKKINNSSYENTTISKKSEPNNDDIGIINTTRNDEYLCDIIRNYLFSKIKRKPKIEKTVKFKIEDENIKDKIYGDNLCVNNGNRNSSNDNTKISYDKRKIKRIIFH